MAHKVPFRALVGVIELTSWNGFFMSNSFLGMPKKNVFHICKWKKKSLDQPIKSGLMSVVLFFYGFSCDFMPLLGWLVRFIHPGFDTWCRPATATKTPQKTFSCSCDVAQEEPRGAWRFTPLNRLFEVRSDDILVLSSYSFFKFEACYCSMSSWFLGGGQRRFCKGVYKICDSQRLSKISHQIEEWVGWKGHRFSLIGKKYKSGCVSYSCLYEQT